MSEMPFTQQPTMLMGIDMYQKILKNKSKYVTGLSATMDRNFAKYHNECHMSNDLMSAHKSIYDMSKRSLIRFQNISKIFPQNIIVYREGTSEG